MEILNELLQIDTTSPEAINMAMDTAAQYLKAAGIECTLLDQNGLKNLVAVIGTGEKTLVLNGHLDVVSGTPAQFIPVETDGRLYARGSADMKSGCTAMMNALIRLKDADLGCKVMLQLVPDEETGGRNGSAFLVSEGYIGDFVICTEPTNLRISIQSKGIILMDIVTRGASAHGSRPWEGENAIVKAMENYERIAELPVLKQGSALYKTSSVNLARISGGNIYNRVPDECTIGLDIRFIPELDSNDILAEIAKVTDGEIVVKAVEDGVNVKPDNPYILKLQESMQRTAPGLPAALAAQHGGSDTRFFAAKGIPAIEMGPSGDGWHGEHEYVELDSVRQLEDILVDYALHFS